MRTPLFAAALSLAALTPALAEEVVFSANMPSELVGMKLLDAKAGDNEAQAFYEGPAGRGTVRLMKAPVGDPGGAWTTGDKALRGDTPAAKLVLMEMMRDNLARGTKALGPNYELQDLKFDSLTMPDFKATCAISVRAQDKSKVESGKKPLFLKERICAGQIGEEMVTTYLTLPTFKAQDKDDNMAQVAFTGEMFRLLSAKK